MSSMPTPNFVITEDFSVGVNTYTTKLLPAGSFVRPIETRYVPEHVLENPLWKLQDKKHSVFCYTKIGFVLIPWHIIRRA